MEEYRDLELTLAVFRALLERARPRRPRRRHRPAGLPARLARRPSSDLAAWATRAACRRRRAASRSASSRAPTWPWSRSTPSCTGGPQAPYPTKADVDASYKRLLERALDPCWGDARARRPGVAQPLRRGLGPRAGRAAGHARPARSGDARGDGPGRGRGGPPAGRTASCCTPPVVPRRRVRRRHRVPRPPARREHRPRELPAPPVRAGARHGPAFADQRDRFLSRASPARHHVDTTPRRTQDRANEVRRFALTAPFTNEPDTDWSRRRQPDLAPARAGPGSRDDRAAEIPLVDRRRGRAAGHGAAPASTRRRRTWPLYRYALADLATRRPGRRRRPARPGPMGAPPRRRHRAGLLLRCAEVLAARRGEAIAVMARDAGKTVAQSDPEVSEAVDMADLLRPPGARGSTTSTPTIARRGRSWWRRRGTSRYAIPAGGVLAALAAGNTVVLKPAPETVATAWLLARCLWDAGIPRDVLQFLPCPDDDVGRGPDHPSRRRRRHPHRSARHRPPVPVVEAGPAAARRDLGQERHRGHRGGRPRPGRAATSSPRPSVTPARSARRRAWSSSSARCSTTAAFLASLADATRTLRVGPATDPATDVGPLIGPPSDRLARALHDLEPGERWLVEPRPLDGPGHLWSPGIRLGVAPGLVPAPHRVLRSRAGRDGRPRPRPRRRAAERHRVRAHRRAAQPRSRRGRAVAGRASRWATPTSTGRPRAPSSAASPSADGSARRSGPAAKAGGPDYVVSLGALVRPGRRPPRPGRGQLPAGVGPNCAGPRIRPGCGPSATSTGTCRAPRSSCASGTAPIPTTSSCACWRRARPAPGS